MNYFLSTASKAGRYYRTLRHLRFSQLSGQVMARVKRQFLDPAKMLAKVTSTGYAWPAKPRVLELPAPAVPQNPGFLAEGKFTFINQTAELGNPVDWKSPAMPRLWNYNLHYFDWIWSLLDDESESEDLRFKVDGANWGCAKRLVEDWIDNHLPSRSAGGWEPYPTSLRLMNWCLLFGSEWHDELDEHPRFKEKLLESIAKQVKWLELNLETHIQANHLLENLVALVTVGTVLEGAEAQRLLRKYQPMLERELEEQFLADGLHYERSPMYHLRMLWLVEVLDATVSPVEVENLSEASLSGLLERGKAALSVLRHPDGEIALFNDAAIGIYYDAWQDVAPPMGAWSLAEAGYYGFRDVAGNYLCVDAGAVGPDYQPGHAHADYLSFELSLGGKRIVTDTGIGTYDTGERRSYDRSTAAHSTVEIEGGNSAEVWGGFRVGRRVEPRVLEFTETQGAMVLEAEHSGYSHLPSMVVHRRRFEMQGAELRVEDVLQCRDSATAVSRIHFAPECAVELVDGGAVVELAGEKLRVLVAGATHLKLVRAEACLEFGVNHERFVLELHKQLAPGENTWGYQILTDQD